MKVPHSFYWKLAVATLLLLPVFAPAQTPGEHDTGFVQMAVWDDGSLGRDNEFNGTGFIYRDQQGLFSSTLIAATFEIDIPGFLYSMPSDFLPVEPITPIMPPIEGFDQGFRSVFDDSRATLPLGILVTQRSYSSTEPDLADFVILDYTIENRSGSEFDYLYVGNFADWDVGLGGLDNNACYDKGSQVLFVWSNAPERYYYGVSVVNNTVSGWSTTHDDGSPGGTPLSYWMAFGDGPCSDAPGDMRPIIGQGPFGIPDGGQVRTWFCMVGGDDEADLIANAHACKAVVEAHTSAVEPTPEGEPGTHRLSPVYPNPFNPESRFTLDVAGSQHVRIALYDALGREVAVLQDGLLAAGPSHTFTIDGANLPSGVYLVRVVGERFAESRLVSLVK